MRALAFFVYGYVRRRIIPIVHGSQLMNVKNRIAVQPNGPLLVTGDIEIYNAQGALMRQTEEVALCRCGQSKNKPFCDGSHLEADFESDGIFANITAEEPAGEGRLTITVREHAGLLAKGAMDIVSADGKFSVVRNEAALCNCGESGNKPFCDDSHEECRLEE